MSKKLLCPFSSGAVTASYCDGDKCRLWRSVRIFNKVYTGCVFEVDFDIRLAKLIE